jgi:Protein of unknown function (DUF2568)
MFIGLLHYANLGIAFLLELGVLAALGYFGFVSGRNWLAKIGLGLGLPVVAAVIWGQFGSPQAVWHLSGFWFLLLQIAWFGSAVMALYAVRRRGLGIAFGLVFVLNTALAYAWGQQ